MEQLRSLDDFERRHQSADHEAEMLAYVKASSMDHLIEEAIPEQIRCLSTEALPQAIGEQALWRKMKQLASENQPMKQYIGLGYAETRMPAVIQRNVLENPAWYTAYTPYQSEIAQGRLEVLLYFQTLVVELTGLPLSGASLLDEATSALEAMRMCYRLRSRSRREARKVLVLEPIYPQTLAVLSGNAPLLGLEVVCVRDEEAARELLSDDQYFALLLQYPDAEGAVFDRHHLLEVAQKYEVRSIVCSDLLSLSLLKPPGEWGADVVVGSAQRFGIPIGYGGPHPAYFATRTEYQRQMPGRIIGRSKDTLGREAYRMALQTREQHIKKARATSNICTSQVLLAIIAAFYAIYHGPQGLSAIAERIHMLARTLAEGLAALGLAPAHKSFFDTLKVPLLGIPKAALMQRSEAAGYNLRYYPSNDAVGITLGEDTEPNDIEALLGIFAEAAKKEMPSVDRLGAARIPHPLKRRADYLSHPIFNSYHTEHALLRLIRRLEERDLSLVHSMIPLGSCTMKLNATSEMRPLSWEAFSGIHPFAPTAQARGYHKIMSELSDWLAQITGFAGVSFQPNSGAQGEYAGLSTIRAYHQSKGEHGRKVVLIPASAHGTNPASAQIAGLEVEIVPCDEEGNTDLEALEATARACGPRLSALMITYPSTHGVFEEDITKVCEIIHKEGGEVYMDGANMNAQIGLTSPAQIGADVCHLNLHKTFCIPHGGGGPGMGPIAVRAHLLPYLPQHPLSYDPGAEAAAPITAAPYGSASLLTISYAYIAMMGGEGLLRASQRAILHANYLKERLSESGYTILYANKKHRVAHEFIVDCRPFQKIDISVEDMAKRLIDYGFHAPTISFPVPGTMMIEPTESENYEEMDRFCSAMASIREEIRAIEEGRADREDNVLKHAPHTVSSLLEAPWPHAYSRIEAAYPLPYLYERKYWPPTTRIDNAAGDRELRCSCAPVSSYEEVERS